MGRCGFVSTARCVMSISAALISAARAESAARSYRTLSPDRAALQERAQAVFAPLPEVASKPGNPVTDAAVTLGRTLYFDPRFSKSQEISCNSCHPLDRFGADGEATSPGHGGQRGERNSPTVYNAALHVSQFWDGRAADVEEQAKGPILDPEEMAMAENDVIAVLESIPGYASLFAAAFPETETPIDYDNMARAIGAFERRLLTPAPFDAFLEGALDALDDDALRGLESFLDTGCTTCHNGVGVGGGMLQKLGLVRPYPSGDVGRAKVTSNDAERYFFKVPSLRNVAETAPYFHDGSVATLDEAIRIMAAVQLGRDLAPHQVDSIRAFLGSLTGTPDPALTARPELPRSGPHTPAPGST